MVRILLLVTFVISFSCTPGSDNSTYKALSATDKAKFDKYMILGEVIYNNTCLNCHQKDGKGLHGIIPPLAQSDYLSKQQASIACLLKNGTQDTIMVNGVSYPPQMPAHKLSNLELAEVITFINNTWDNEFGFVPVQAIDKQIRNCNPTY
jgi:mono/diheme cytochrome c family protein